MKIFFGVAVYLLAIFTLVSQARQQPPSTGTYTTYLGSQIAGTDSYTITTNADGSRKAEADVAFLGSKHRTKTIVAPGKPASFSLETNGTSVFSAEFGLSTVKVRAMNQPEREVKTGATVVLENAVWHHYIFLLDQYDAGAGGTQSFKAFLPSQAIEFSIDVERISTQTYTVNNRLVETQRFRGVTGQSLVIDVWTDAARVPLLFQITSQGVKVIRRGSEQLAEVVWPPAKPVVNALFSSEEVTFQNGDVALAGTLTLPKNKTAPFPVAVLISGSGAQDRDGSGPVFNLYKHIAERLSENGIAVLRADDRGAGKSSLGSKPPSYRDIINDTKAAVEYLRSRHEIDQNRIALIGHSEGALTAPIIASEDSRIAAIALLSATSRSVDKIVLEQSLYMMALQESIDPSDISKRPAIVRQLMKAFDDAKANSKTDAAAATAATTGKGAATDHLAWFREHAATDPLEIIRRVRCPVLIVQGERDAQVLAYHAVEIAQALADAGHRKAHVRVLPNLGHSFTPSSLDRSVPAERRTEISPDFLQTLQTWAVDVLASDKDKRSGK